MALARKKKFGIVFEKCKQKSSRVCSKSRIMFILNYCKSSSVRLIRLKLSLVRTLSNGAALSSRTTESIRDRRFLNNLNRLLTEFINRLESLLESRISKTGLTHSLLNNRLNQISPHLKTSSHPFRIDRTPKSTSRSGTMSGKKRNCSPRPPTKTTSRTSAWYCRLRTSRATCTWAMH